MRPKVLVTRHVHDEALDLLRRSCDVILWDSDDLCPRHELLEKVKGVEGIFCTISDKIDQEVLNSAGKQLAVIATMSTDSHHINEQECRQRDIMVTTVPDSASDAAAEMACTLLLMAARRCLEGHAAVLNGEWGPWKPMWICGTEMHERTLGLLGMGRVGFGVARRMKPFGITRIIYNDVQHSPFAQDIGAQFVDQDTLFKESDFLVICASLNPSTNKLVNRDALAKMKPSAILVNSSRGPIVCNDALADALKNQKITAAALDVTDPEPLPTSHPLAKMPNCVITPHLGTNTTKTRLSMAINTAKNLIAVLINRAVVKTSLDD